MENKTFGNFTFIPTEIKDVYVIEVKKYGDNRGYFMETYKKQTEGELEDEQVDDFESDESFEDAEESFDE